MKIYLTSAYDDHPNLDELRLIASKDSIARHRVCNSPEEAEAILFVENAQFDDYLYRRLSRHTLLKRFPDKVFIYNEVDKPWCVIPGLYCSMPKRFFQQHRQVSFPFVKTPNQYIPEVHKWQLEKRWLFSFVGAASHRCRRDIFALVDGLGGVRDTSDFNVWDSTTDERAAQGKVFADSMARSHFMLCPRGIGPTSFRLFETLEAGRTPVIIANQWVPPPQINWDFAIRVDERKIHTIPTLLRSMVGEAEERGRAARDAWLAAYAPEVFFDTAIESIGYLLDVRRARQSSDPWQAARKLLIQGEIKTLGTVRRLRQNLHQVMP